MRGLLTALASLCLLAASTSLYGQQIRGSIVGNVTDTSGAVIPGAQITVKNEETGIEVNTRTDTSGTYTVPDLLASTYTVSVASQGFKTHEFKGIRLLTGQTARQDAVLEVGEVNQTIEVNAPPQLVQTDSPTVGGTLGTNEISNLPVITTSPDRLLDLVPGMSTGITNGNGNPIVGGAPYLGSTNFTVNGISTTNAGQGGGGNVTYVSGSEMIALVNLPSIGTMQEFKVDASVNSAEYRGQVSVQMVTKQGTNKYHGQLYYANENKALNANYFDLNAYNIPQNPFNRNQFGGSFGGPILHDKLFFFVAYDGIREIHPSPGDINLPSMAMRQGDFSALCSAYAGGVCSDPNGTQLYNPLTGQPFPNNQIPDSMITSQAKMLNSYLPAPTVASSPGLPDEAPNWHGATPLRYGTNNEQARLDYQLRKNDSIVAFFNGSRGYPWFYGYAGPPNFGNWSDHGYNFLNFALTETHTFTPNIINEFRVGWTYTLRNKIGQNLGFAPWDIFPGMPKPASPDGGLPSIDVPGYGSTNINGLFSDVGIARGRQNAVDFVDNFTMVRGRHTIKAGFEETGYKDEGVGGLTGAPPLGYFSFYAAWTGNLGWPSATHPRSAGNGFADFLLGFADSTSYGFNANPYLLSRYWEWYVQDTWKVTPRLTLNYGVRYTYQRPWIYRDHNATFFDFANNKLVLAQNSDTPTLPPGANPKLFEAYSYTTTQAIGASLDFFNGDKNNWGPRLGFAYRPFSDNKTVIRGGWGMFYSLISAWAGPRNLQFLPPWGGTNGYSTNLPGEPTTPYLPDLTFEAPFPSELAGGVSGHPSLTAVDQNILNPITQQWNLTAERQVGQSWSFRATYAGSQTHHLLPPNGLDANWPLEQQPNVPRQKQRPLQPWSTITYYTTAASSNFHQGQFEAQKQFSEGLSFRAEYDYTRALDNVGYYSGRQNPRDLRSEYGNMSFQYRHRFQVYYVYDLPVGRGKKWLANSNAFVNGVLGGWRVSGITTYHSGRVLTATLNTTGNKIGWLASYPDRVAGTDLYAGRQSGHDTVSGVQWFNPDAFTPPQPWTYGNAQPRSLFGPGYSNWDLSVMKGWGLPFLGEAGRFEFKADFFNLPNHYNLDDPDTGIPNVQNGGSPSSSVGKIYGGNGPPRFIQLGLRLQF